jgi:hypothetical protein
MPLYKRASILVHRSTMLVQQKQSRFALSPSQCATSLSRISQIRRDIPVLILESRPPMTSLGRRGLSLRSRTLIEAMLFSFIDLTAVLLLLPQGPSVSEAQCPSNKQSDLMIHQGLRNYKSIRLVSCFFHPR